MSVVFMCFPTWEDDSIFDGLFNRDRFYDACSMMFLKKNEKIEA